MIPQSSYQPTMPDAQPVPSSFSYTCKYPPPPLFSGQAQPKYLVVRLVFLNRWTLIRRHLDVVILIFRVSAGKGRLLVGEGRGAHAKLKADPDEPGG